VAKLEKPLDLSMSKITTGQWDEIAADLGIDAAGLQTFTDATTTDAPRSHLFVAPMYRAVLYSFIKGTNSARVHHLV
jgi:hypothetical protein